MNRRSNDLNLRGVADVIHHDRNLEAAYLPRPADFVRLDVAEHVWRNREGIKLFTVMTHAMPPNNITQMTADERRTLARWLAKL